jgi:hypothetical protein
VHPYAGQSVWIGTEDDVSVPQDVVRRWRESLTAATVSATPGVAESQGMPLSILDSVLARWATPGAALSNAALQEGQHATIEIRRVSDQYVIVSKNVVVRRARSGDAIQEVVLE